MSAWSLFGHLWWALPALLAIGGGIAFALGFWPAVVALLGRLPPKLQAVLLAVLCAVVAASGLYGLGRSHENAEMTLKLHEQRRLLGELREANGTQRQTIADLQEANEAFAEIAQVNRAEAEQLIREIAASRDRAEAELKRLRRERETIYANDPSAAAWARQPVPDAVADQLRE